MRGSFEIGATGSDSVGVAGVVMAGPWPPREVPAGAFANDSATIERLTAKLERLERREEALQKQVSELVEQSHQAGRLQALAESLRNSRDYKVDDVVRQVKELRARVEAIEGPRAEFAGAAHRSLVAIDRQLAALRVPEAPARRARGLRGWVLGGVLMTTLAGAFLAWLAVAAPLV